MFILRSAALVAVMALAACGSSPLPKEMPEAFLFELERDYRAVALSPVEATPAPEVPAEVTAETVPAVPEDEARGIGGERISAPAFPRGRGGATPLPMPGSTGDPEETEQAVAEEEPAAEEPAAEEPAAEEPAAEEPPVVERERKRLPPYLKVVVDATGRVAYVLQFGGEGEQKKTSEGELTLSPQSLAEIYSAIRDADPFDLDLIYTGDDKTKGIEIYHFRGRNKEQWIEVRSARVEPLERLVSRVVAALPSTLFEAPLLAQNEWFLDRQDGRIHRVGCPDAREVSEESRVPLGSPYQGLNVPGAWPCPVCEPTSGR